MDIFESLENLNVSEECFEDIVGLVEEFLSEDGLVQKAYSYLAGPSKDGREESIGTKVDRASVKHPVLSKALGTINRTVNAFKNKNKKFVDTRTPEEKLRNVKPAGTIYGRDMYSPAQLKDAGYKPHN